MRAMLGINIFNAKAGALEGDVSFVQRRSTERRQGQCHQTCLGNHRTKGASIYVEKNSELIGNFFIDMLDYQRVLYFILLLKHS